MKTWRWVVFFLGAGLIGAAACKKSSTVDDDDATTTTHTGTGSGTTTTTVTGSGTTSTGTGTGGTCDVDLAAEVGASAECSTCMAENCCAEAQGFLDDQSTAQAALDCADAAGCVDAQGMRYCITAWCQEEFGVAFFQGLVECNNTSCCTQWDAMQASTTNWDTCAVDPMPAECCVATAAYKLWEDCMNTNCAGTGWPEGGWCAG
jgi:hypothetical protein